MSRSLIGGKFLGIPFLLGCLFCYVASYGQALTNVMPPGAVQGPTLSVGISGQSANFSQSTATIITVDPNSADQGDVLSVTISGQNTTFDQGTSTIPLWFIQGSETIFPSSMVIISPTELIAGFTIPQFASLGPYNVDAIDPINGYMSKASGFYVTAPNPPGCNLGITLWIGNETGPGANDGSVLAVVTNGTPPHTYSWNTGATTSSISGLAPGIYTCNAIDALGCNKTETTAVQAFLCTLTGSVSSTSESTAGANDGTAIISASGGSTPYTYLWGSGQTSTSIVNLSAGIYDVTVTDAIGCTYTTAVAVNVAGCSIAVTITGTNESQVGANNGSASAVVLGTPPYVYQWSNGATTSSINGLAPGNYTVQVTDAMFCFVTGTYTVTPAQWIGIGPIGSEGVSVNVYPNPASDVLNFEVTGVRNVEIHIYSFAGKLLDKVTARNDKLEIYTGDLPNGIYLYQVIASNSSVAYSGKFLIAR